MGKIICLRMRVRESLALLSIVYHVHVLSSVMACTFESADHLKLVRDSLLNNCLFSRLAFRDTHTLRYKEKEDETRRKCSFRWGGKGSGVGSVRGEMMTAVECDAMNHKKSGQWRWWEKRMRCSDAIEMRVMEEGKGRMEWRPEQNA